MKKVLVVLTFVHWDIMTGSFMSKTMLPMKKLKRE